MKTNKLRLALILIFCFSTFQAGALLAQVDQKAILEQIEASRSIGQERWRELVEINMQLSEEEGELFWPIYNQYSDEMVKLNDRLLKLITSFAESYNNENLSNETATNLIQEHFAIQKQKIKIQEKYNTKLQKVLPTKRVMRFIQVENKLSALVDAGLALQIPLAE